MNSQRLSMNRNSYDFSLAETSSLAQVDSDQNPSWINLRCLKDMIKQSTTERVSYSSKENSNFNSRSLPPQQNPNQQVSVVVNNTKTTIQNSQSIYDQKRYNSKGSQSSRHITNPKDLLKFSNQISAQANDETFTTDGQNEQNSNQNAQVLSKRLSNSIEPLDTLNNYFSNDYDFNTKNNFQQQTLVMNHIDTPQSILIPELKGHEIESLLKDEIAHHLLNSDDNTNIFPSDLIYDTQASPYGKTQEFDIQNMHQEECINYIQTITQQDDNKTELGQITHRVYQNEGQQNINNVGDISPQRNTSSLQGTENNSQQLNRSPLSGNNLFKRQKNQPSQARESINSSRLSIGQSNIEIKQINLNIENQNKKALNDTKGHIITHSRKVSQLIDLTKKSFDNFQAQKQVQINLVENLDDKENQNPYQTHTGLPNKSQKQLEDQDSSFRIVDKDFDQFCDQIEKMRSQQNPAAILQTSLNNTNEVSFKRKNHLQMKSVDRVYTQQTQETPLKLLSHQSFELSESQSNKSPTMGSNSNTITLQTENKMDQLQQSPAPQIDSTMQQSFKRNRPVSNNFRNNNNFKNKSKNQNSLLINQQVNIDVSQIEQQSSLDMSIQSLSQNVIQDELQELHQRQRLELITLKKENTKLTRQIETQKKDHEKQLEQLRQELTEQQILKVKEVEDENLIIIEGVRQEYEDKINEVINQHQIKVQAMTEEHHREIMHKESKIEKKREKLYKLRDQFDEKRKEYNAILIELEAYKSKVEEMTQYQLQNNVSNNESQQNNRDSVGNIFMTSQSCDNLRMPLSHRNQVGYFTTRDNDIINNDDLHPFRNSDHKQPTPYQSFDNFLDIKKKTQEQQLDIPSIIKSLNNNNHNHSVHAPHNENNDPNYQANLNFYFSLSQQQQQQQHQQEDSAMNFSFSECVKQSIDNKSALFDNNKHLDKISQNDHEDEDDDDEDLYQNQQTVILHQTTNTNANNNVNDTSQDYCNINNTTSNHPQYESDTDDQQQQFKYDSKNQTTNDLHNYITSSGPKTDSHKTASLQHSQIIHEELEPSAENYVDDEELETDQQLDDDASHDQQQYLDDELDQEESKSNLSYKLDDMTSGGASQQQRRGMTNNIINQNVIYQIDDIDEEEYNQITTSQNNKGQRSRRQQNDYDDEGSENAPEDSGFLSDEGEQERIVNESSLYNEDDFNQSQNLLLQTVSGDPYLLYSDAFEQDPNLIMTGRSESAMDENDDEIEGISKCKAINSSYINLKRNNLLIAYGKR